MLQLDSCLEIAKSAALLAGKYIKDRHNQDLEILLNEGRDIKLQIDVDAEKIIKDHLIAKSSFPILAEESGASNELNELYWAVAPLDGTSNFLRNINDQETEICARSERAMLEAIGGNCETAVGGLAVLKNDNLKLTAQLFSDSGLKSYEYEMMGKISDAVKIGKSVGKELLKLAGSEFKKK